MTWFRKDGSMRWFVPGSINEIIAVIESKYI
jgi:hypothetical protein